MFACLPFTITVAHGTRKAIGKEDGRRPAEQGEERKHFVWVQSATAEIGNLSAVAEAKFAAPKSRTIAKMDVQSEMVTCAQMHPIFTPRIATESTVDALPWPDLDQDPDSDTDSSDDSSVTFELPDIEDTSYVLQEEYGAARVSGEVSSAAAITCDDSANHVADSSTKDTSSFEAQVPTLNF